MSTVDLPVITECKYSILYPIDLGLRGIHTITGPGRLGCASDERVLVHLEPHSIGGVPGVDILALRNLGQVGLLKRLCVSHGWLRSSTQIRASECRLTDRSRVVQVIVEGDGHLIASRNTDCIGSGIKLVAPDVVGSHVADEAIVLPVLGLADRGPVRSSVDDGERVFMVRSLISRLLSICASEVIGGGGPTVSGGRRGGKNERSEVLHGHYLAVETKDEKVSINEQ